MLRLGEGRWAHPLSRVKETTSAPDAPGKAGGQLLCELELYVLIREIIGEWKQNL